ncbi:AraC family transcriptional regulator [Candidatus Dojkabacteria bacterium]|nr:AraC family transcriptional regulator [Candidatus Dojkabacteria bacterium]
MQDQQSQKSCIVCGMPLLKDEDYPEGADQNSTDWCKHCGSKDGLKSYSEAVTGMSGFMQHTQGMSEEEAQKAAKQVIDNCPAVKSGRMKKDE